MGLLCFGLLTSTQASASAFEQIGIFAGSLAPPKEPGVFPEEMQLGGVGGMAVNSTGIGGVPAGTLYTLTAEFGAELRVAMFTPSGEGLKFSQAWQVTPTEEPYKRCGPDAPGSPICSTRSVAGAAWADVEVDQASGNVYVFSALDVAAGDMAIREYNADGSEVIARFGEKAPNSETTAESAMKIHRSSRPGGLAVNNAGEVYVYDVDAATYHRLMVFKPESPGDFEHYVYAGKESDIGAGFLGEGQAPERPITDTAGNIYTTNEVHIQEYDPATPATPICDFEAKAGGIVAMTVNPETGEPFYYSYKDKNIHQLSACKEGKFTQKSEIARTLAAKRGDIYALAFDPNRKIGNRPPGVLYAGVPEPQVGETAGAIGYIFAPAEENPPVVESESVAKVTESSAELRARVNPKGFETRYVFQYLTDAAYTEAGESFNEATEAPLGGAVVGSGQSPLVGAVAVAGLLPDTVYRYRVIATSHCVPSEEGKICTTAGSPQTFGTFPDAPPGASLPDGRAYELVSPAQKNGGQVLPADPTTSSCGLAECKSSSALQHFPMQSTPDGEAIVYEGTPFSPGKGAVLENEYRAVRTESGWVTVNLTPPLLRSKGGQGYKAFDPALQEGLLEQTSPSFGPPAPSEFTNLYRQPVADPLALEPLVTEAPPHRPPGDEAERLKLIYAGASDDLSRIFFQANDELHGEGGGGEAGETNLYEWFAGQLHLVNVGPAEEVIPGAVFGSGKLLKAGNPNILIYAAANAISTDGTRAFWSSPGGQLYLRLDGTTTIEIPDHTGKFLVAAADGSRVLLSDGHIFSDLEAQTPSEVDLTQGKGGFEGIAGRSEDLSHIYFVDTAVLDPEENSEGAKAQAGKDNLYLFAEGTTTYIATLLGADNSGGEGDWSASPARRTAEASPDGGWLTFLSQAQLSGYGNVGPCVVNGETGEFLQAPCPEVFLYDATTDQLSCPSCNRSGAPPLGHSTLRINKGVVDSLPQPRYLADSGRLFFDSQDSLVPADSNGGVEDVYEFEPDKVGGCGREGGCVSLISRGGGQGDSNFLAMDKSGDNVFFTTREPLVRADKDALIDLYDARVGGGFEFESELPPGKCEIESCPPPPASQPELPPASESLDGSGNVTEPPPKHCKKGQVRRGRRCVKKPHHRHHRAKVGAR